MEVRQLVGEDPLKVGIFLVRADDVGGEGEGVRGGRRKGRRGTRGWRLLLGHLCFVVVLGFVVTVLLFCGDGFRGSAGGDFSLCRFRDGCLHYVLNGKSR